MATSIVSTDRPRRLAELRPDHGRVLSVFFDLDPREFATPPARATQLTSILDSAEKAVDAEDGLEHDTRMALRADIDRVREVLERDGIATGRVRGLAVYAHGPDGVLELFRTPHPVPTRVVLDRAPFLAPLLLAGGERERWCVVLASRRHGRIFVGDDEGFEELGDVFDDTPGQHDQGGWSQKRFQRSIEHDKVEHLDRLAERLRTLLAATPFDRLLIAAPEPLDDELEARLHPSVAERLSGRVALDVDTSNADDVLRAATPVFIENARERQRVALERMREGVSKPDGRAVAGLEAVLEALEQGRVEALLIDPRANIDEHAREAAIRRAVEQSAEVLAIGDFPDLGPHGGIAALLRF